MLNHTVNPNFGNKIYGMINMEAIPKFDIKSVIKSDIKFDISIKPITWIGQKYEKLRQKRLKSQDFFMSQFLDGDASNLCFGVNWWEFSVYCIWTGKVLLNFSKAHSFDFFF